MTRTAHALLAAASTILAACGGGSSDGGNIALPGLADITSTNAPTISSAVMSSMLEGTDLGSFTGLSTGAGSSPLMGKAVFAKVGSLQTDGVQTLLKQRQLGIFQAPIDPVTENCLDGGTMTLSANLANPSTMSQGDTISFTYVNCAEGTTIVNGTFGMTVTSFSGDMLSGAFSFRVSVSLSGFTIVDDGVLATADGDITITLTATSQPTLDISVTATSLTVSADGQTNTLTDLTISQGIDSVAATYTLDASGSLTSSVFEGRVDFATTVTLQGMGEGNAFSGELVITGAANATIRIMVLDATMLRLEIDTNGDGTPDESIDRSWDELT